jgi:hypothetical protein
MKILESKTAFTDHPNPNELEKIALRYPENPIVAYIRIATGKHEWTGPFVTILTFKVITVIIARP